MAHIGTELHHLAVADEAGTLAVLAPIRRMPLHLPAPRGGQFFADPVRAFVEDTVDPPWRAGTRHENDRMSQHPIQG